MEFGRQTNAAEEGKIMRRRRRRQRKKEIKTHKDSGTVMKKK